MFFAPLMVVLIAICVFNVRRSRRWWGVLLPFLSFEAFCVAGSVADHQFWRSVSFNVRLSRGEVMETWLGRDGRIDFHGDGTFQTSKGATGERSTNPKCEPGRLHVGEDEWAEVRVKGVVVLVPKASGDPDGWPFSRAFEKQPSNAPQAAASAVEPPDPTPCKLMK